MGMQGEGEGRRRSLLSGLHLTKKEHKHCLLRRGEEKARRRIWQIPLSREGSVMYDNYTLLSVGQMELCHETDCTKGPLSAALIASAVACSIIILFLPLSLSFVCCKNCRHAWNSSHQSVGGAGKGGRVNESQRRQRKLNQLQQNARSLEENASNNNAS